METQKNVIVINGLSTYDTRNPALQNARDSNRVLICSTSYERVCVHYFQEGKIIKCNKRTYKKNFEREITKILMKH